MPTRGTQLALALAAVSLPLALWNFDIIPHEAFGIANFPVSYLLGLVVGSGAVAISSFKNSRTRIGWLALILLEACLWLVPLRLMPILPFAGSNHDFTLFPDLLGLTLTGHLNPNALIYQSLPGFYILGSAFLTLSGMQNYLQIFEFTPFCLNLVASVFLYIFFRALLKPSHTNLALVAVALFELLNFAGVTTEFAFFSLAYLYFYFGLAVFAGLGFFERQLRKIGGGGYLTLFLLFGAMSITHPEVALALLSVLFLVTTGRSIASKKWSLIRSYLTLDILMTSILFSWTLYGATSFISAFQSTFRLALEFSPLSFLWGGTVTTISTASQGHAASDLVKTGVVASVCILSLPALARMRRGGVVSIMSYALIGIVIEAVLVGNFQGVSFVPRFFGYALPFILILNVLSLRHSKHVFVLTAVFLVASSPAFVATSYANVEVDLLPSSVIQAATYFGNMLPSLTEYGQYSVYEFQVLGTYGPNPSNMIPYIDILSPTSQLIPSAADFFSTSALATASFIVTGTNTQQFISFYGGSVNAASEVTNHLAENSSYDVVYSSSSVILFTNPK